MGTNCNFANDKHSQPCVELVSRSRQSAKHIILQPYNTQKDFITSINYPDGKPGYNFYVFDTRHHQNYSSAQPIKVKFDFMPAVPAATNLIGNALLLTKKIAF